MLDAAGPGPPHRAEGRTNARRWASRPRPSQCSPSYGSKSKEQPQSFSVPPTDTPPVPVPVSQVCTHCPAPTSATGCGVPGGPLPPSGPSSSPATNKAPTCGGATARNASPTNAKLQRGAPNHEGGPQNHCHALEARSQTATRMSAQDALRPSPTSYLDRAHPANTTTRAYPTASTAARRTPPTRPA